MSRNARRSIRHKASVSGTGLHTGAQTEATFLPAPAGQGIVFRRVDLEGKPEVPALLSEVEAIERRTAIGKGDTTIHTVEHLLAAVAAHEIDDLIVELSGPEPPILDGSVQPYFEALEQAGPTETGGEPVILSVQAPFTVTEGDASYIVAPAKELRLTVTIEWPHPLIGRQAGTYTVTPQAFARDLAPARTFGFTSEVAGLQAKGLIKGASSANAIVLDDRGLADGGQLRWPDEFVRHKAADILGDLALTGGRVRAHIVATRPSHGGNIALAHALARAARRTGGGAPKMDIGRIMDVLPHRYPFLLVDRIIEVEGRQRIVGIKNVTINEPFFQGHFPGHPVMPAVLILEAMAQVGGMLMLNSVDDPAGKLMYFMGIDGAKFRRPVVPGDQLRFKLTLLSVKRRTMKMRGEAFVDGGLVAEAELLAAVVDRRQ